MNTELMTEEETRQKLLEILNASEMHNADIAQMLAFMFIAYCHSEELPKKNVMKLMDKWWRHCINLKKDFTTH